MTTTLKIENPSGAFVGAHVWARLAGDKRVMVQVLSEPHPETGLRRIRYGHGLHAQWTVAE